MKILRYVDVEGAVHLAQEHADGRRERLLGDLFDPMRPSGEEARMAQLLAPIEPRAIYCIGLNYRRHAEETGAEIPQRPVVFMKAPSALQHPGLPIELPTALVSQEVDVEGELAVVIGRAAKNVSRAEALSYVLGYSCANDVSARDWQKRLGGGQWCRGKTFDTFAPLGPALVTPDSIPDPNRLRLRTVHNGVTVQDANTSDMIFDVAELIAFLSGSTTLQPGTLILTGTPSGVGMAADPPRWLRAGDRVSVVIEGIGSLDNSVIDEPALRPKR